MYVQIKSFYEDLKYKKDLNPIELAAWTHADLEEKQLDEYLKLI